MRITKPVDFGLLERELEAASVAVNGLGTSGESPEDPGAQELFTYDEAGEIAELPPEAEAVVLSHDASKPQRTAAFEAAEDTERLRIINERARVDPAFAALAELALKGTGL